MVVTRTQPKANQRTRIGHRLRLPAVIGLIAPHRIFAGLIPGSGRFAAEVVLADQRFLDRLCPLGVDLLLASHDRFMFAVPSRTCLLRLAAL